MFSWSPRRLRQCSVVVENSSSLFTFSFCRKANRRQEPGADSERLFSPQTGLEPKSETRVKTGGKSGKQEQQFLFLSRAFFLFYFFFRGKKVEDFSLARSLAAFSFACCDVRKEKNVKRRRGINNYTPLFHRPLFLVCLPLRDFRAEVLTTPDAGKRRIACRARERGNPEKMQFGSRCRKEEFESIPTSKEVSRGRRAFPLFFPLLFLTCDLSTPSKKTK